MMVFTLGGQFRLAGVESVTRSLKAESICATNSATRLGGIGSRSAKPEIAVPLYQARIKKLQEAHRKEARTGVFGADMQVGLINDGPVTIMMDSKLRE